MLHKAIDYFDPCKDEKFKSLYLATTKAERLGTGILFCDECNVWHVGKVD